MSTVKLHVNDVLAMESITNKLLEHDMPYDSAMELVTFVSHIQCALQNFTVAREQLVDKYKQEPDEEGKIKIAQENIETFNNEIKQLLEEEITIPKISKSVFDNNILVTPKELLESRLYRVIE